MPPCANCGATGTTFSCARCKEEQYCSRACQKASWKQHKLACTARERTAVAPGACTVEALAKRVKTAARYEGGCLCCGAKPKKLVFCSGCGIAGYCDTACQSRDWKGLGDRLFGSTRRHPSAEAVRGDGHKAACPLWQADPRAAAAALGLNLAALEEPELFPDCIVQFLVHSRSQGGPSSCRSIVQWVAASHGGSAPLTEAGRAAVDLIVAETGLRIGAGEERCAFLVASGLLQACFHVIKNLPLAAGGEKHWAGVLLTLAAEKDVTWQYFGAIEHADQNRLGLRGADLRGISMLDLVRLKAGIAAVRLLASHETAAHECGIMNETAVMNCTRLVARCFTFSLRGAAEMYRELLVAAAFTEEEDEDGERGWASIAAGARAARARGSLGSSVVSNCAFDTALAPPPPKDRALMRWMLAQENWCHFADWISSGCWMRSPHVAIASASWAAFRALLMVGAIATAAGRAPCEAQTLAAAQRLRDAPCEERDGSTSRMPVHGHVTVCDPEKGY